MFKKGQVIRSKLSGNMALVQMVDHKTRMCSLYILSGRSAGETLYPFPLVDSDSEVVGNNYQERPTTKAEKPAIDKETHNLIQNLRRDNKELRRQNKDLRDDIGDMASKLHLANKRAFRRWLGGMTSDMLEQRGCRKEDC